MNESSLLSQLLCCWNIFVTTTSLLPAQRERRKFSNFISFLYHFSRRTFVRLLNDDDSLKIICGKIQFSLRRYLTWITFSKTMSKEWYRLSNATCLSNHDDTHFTTPNGVIEKVLDFISNFTLPHIHSISLLCLSSRLIIIILQFNNIYLSIGSINSVEFKVYSLPCNKDLYRFCSALKSLIIISSSFKSLAVSSFEVK